MLIDVHAHLVTAAYRDAAVAAGHVTPDGMPWWPEWDVGGHLDLMAGSGIDRSLLSVSSPGVHLGDDDGAVALARLVNDEAAEVTRAHPGRLGFLASLPLPAVEPAVEEAVRALDTLGAAGIVLMSNSDGVYLGDRRLAPLYAALDERRAAVLVHPTSPPGHEAVAGGRPRPMLEFMFETTRTVADMVFAEVFRRYPHIRFVIPHAGAALPVLAERIERFRRLMPGPDGGPAAPEPTRDQLARLWFDVAGTPFPDAAPALAAVVGEDRLLYGSDFCFTPPSAVDEQLAAIDAAPPPATAPGWRHLLAANGARFLGADD